MNTNDRESFGSGHHQIAECVVSQGGLIMSRPMKDRGVEWIGEMPESWKLRRLRYLCDISTGNLDTQDNNPEGAYPFYVRSPIIERCNSYTFDGDAILMAGDGVGAGKVFHLVSGKYGCHQRVYSMQNIRDIDRCFLFYYLQNTFYVAIDTANSKSTVDSVRLPMLQDFSVPVPCKCEQEKISSFLQEESEEINAVLEKTRSSIEEYKKLKQALITQAVTKGIRPNREMKDSGTEWIGEIPSEWGLRRLNWCLHEINVKNDPIQTTRVLSLTNKLGVVPYEEKGNQGNKAKENFAEYKLAYENTLIVNSMNVIIGSVGISNYFGCVSPVYYVFKETVISDLRFINYIFNTPGFQKELRKYAYGIMEIRLRISSSDLFKRLIPLPNLDEQQEIASYLDDKCTEIDTLIAKKEQFLLELENYKKTLIYEYVTGKKEVS